MWMVPDRSTYEILSAGGGSLGSQVWTREEGVCVLMSGGRARRESESSDLRVGEEGI